MKKPVEEYKYKQTLDLNKVAPSSKDLVQVCCPACNEAVPSINININKEIAKCDHCNGVFSFSDHHEIAVHSNRPKVMQPEGIEILHFQNELDISFHQPVVRGSDVFMSMLFMIFSLLSIVLFIKGMKVNPKLLILFIPTFIIAALSAVRLYAATINKTYITIDDQYLSIVNRPYRFSFSKDQHYLIDEVDQVYIKIKANPNGGKAVYKIFAILNTPKGQKHVEFPPILESKSKAKYIEQEIEHHLGIKDRPVPEED